MSNGNSGGWNRPAANQSNVKKGGAKAPSMWKGIVAGLVIVCVLGGLCLWMFSGRGEDARVQVEKKSSKISEHKPSIASTTSDVKPEVIQPKRSRREEYDLFVSNKLAAARAKSPWGHLPRKVVEPRPTAPRRFEHDSEEYIARLIEIEPGTQMFGDFPLNEKFLEDLKQAMLFPTRTNPEDDDDVRTIKDQVRETVSELKEQLLNGEDVLKVITETRTELMTLAKYKKEILDNLESLRSSGDHSSDDMKLYVEAANKMLESKGMKPIAEKSLIMMRIKKMEAKEDHAND